MISTVLDAFFWFASLLNAALLAHQLYMVWRTRSAEGLSIVMMVGFLVMQIIYAAEGFRTDNLAMKLGWVLSAVCTLGIIAFATKYNRLIRLSKDQQMILEQVDQAFGDRLAVERVRLLREGGINEAEINSLVGDGFLIEKEESGLRYVAFASGALRKEIVARKWHRYLPHS